MLPVFIIMILIIAFQVPALVHNKQYRELVGFVLVWFMATVFTVLVASKAPLPVLVDLLESFYDYIGLF